VRVSRWMSTAKPAKSEERYAVEWLLPITGNTKGKLNTFTLEALEILTLLAEDIERIKEDLDGKPGTMDVRTLEDGRCAIWFGGNTEVYEAIESRLTQLRARVQGEFPDSEVQHKRVGFFGEVNIAEVESVGTQAAEIADEADLAPLQSCFRKDAPEFEPPSWLRIDTPEFVPTARPTEKSLLRMDAPVFVPAAQSAENTDAQAFASALPYWRTDAVEFVPAAQEYLTPSPNVDDPPSQTSQAAAWLGRLPNEDADLQHGQDVVEQPTEMAEMAPQKASLPLTSIHRSLEQDLFSLVIEEEESDDGRLSSCDEPIRTESERPVCTPVYSCSAESTASGSASTANEAELWDDFEETNQIPKMVDSKVLQFENPMENPVEINTELANPQEIPSSKACKITNPKHSWYYVDDDGNVQGPFTSEEMREWYMDDLLPEDLLVHRLNVNEPFPSPKSFATLDELLSIYIDF